MKRVISTILAVLMVLTCIPVLADSTHSKDMEKALIAVKEKLDIPVELSEFTVNTYQNNGEITYSFMWQDKEGRAYIEAAGDSNGRISRYYFYDSSLKNEKKLTLLTKSDILEFAESFLKKTVPKAFRDETDLLIFDESSWNVNNMDYRLVFRRFKDGIEVKDNLAEIRITVFNDVAYVRSMDVYMNYSAEFEKPEKEAEDIKGKYKEVFPAELIYKDEYNYRRTNDQDKNKTVLVYRFKNNEAGFILASSGEKATEDPWDENGASGGGSAMMNTAAMEDSEAKREILTEQEKKELETIKGLISKKTAQNVLKKLPYVDFDSKLKLNHYDITQNNGKYILSVSYEGEDGKRYISAAFEGQSGELLNMYNRAYYETYKEGELSENQLKSAQGKINEFLKAAAGKKLDEFEEETENVNGKTVRKGFERRVDGIRYISDSISVQFDGEKNRITSYSIDFESDKEFKKAEGVLGEAEAYDALLKVTPLKKIYLYSGGAYKVCFTIDGYASEIDVFTGEKYDPYKNTENTEYEYSDLKGHWAEEKINKLAEIQIGFDGETFNPDGALSQYDLLRLFAAGIYYKSYLGFGEEELYTNLIYEDVISESEKNPKGEVKREDAFVYMVRMDGIEKVAKLDGIFKVEYKDGHLLSKGKIGYPAILTGMGIITGNGGKLRPQETITRAEAMVMLYNYMVR